MYCSYSWLKSLVNFLFVQKIYLYCSWQKKTCQIFVCPKLLPILQLSKKNRVNFLLVQNFTSNFFYLLLFLFVQNFTCNFFIYCYFCLYCSWQKNLHFCLSKILHVIFLFIVIFVCTIVAKEFVFL